jgi:hypothetical protein
VTANGLHHPSSRKESGDIRVLTDFRRLNAVRKKSLSLYPRSDLLYKLEGFNMLLTSAWVTTTSRWMRSQSFVQRSCLKVPHAYPWELLRHLIYSKASWIAYCVQFQEALKTVQYQICENGINKSHQLNMPIKKQ